MTEDRLHYERITRDLVELKDTSEMMIDLADTALLLNSRYLAEEVLRLDEEDNEYRGARQIDPFGREGIGAADARQIVLRKQFGDCRRCHPTGNEQGQYGKRAQPPHDRIDPGICATHEMAHDHDIKLLTDEVQSGDERKRHRKPEEFRQANMIQRID